MIDVFRQVASNLRANKLRSFLTMFGILWGVVSVVVLSATGEGFRLGNQAVLEELGQNVTIVFGGRTSMQAGGERAGRRIRLTVADARALERSSPIIAVVSPEIDRNGIQVKSAYNAGALRVHGIEPQYQQIRTLDIETGRGFRFTDEENSRRVAILGADVIDQLFGSRNPLGETIQMNGLPYAVIGTIRRKDQDSNYSGPDNDKIFVPFSAMARDLPLPNAEPGAVSYLVLAPVPSVIAGMPAVVEQRTGRIADIVWPLAREVRRVLSAQHDFDPADRDAVTIWDTAVQSMMFDRMVQGIKDFFTFVGAVTLVLGGLGVMNIMLVAVRERTREIGLRKALGATTAQIQRQFFLEGFFVTLCSGGLGFGLALGLCALVNTLPMPTRFEGMILTWQAGVVTVIALVLVGVVTSTYPARRAAQLPPVEALRFEA